MKKRILAKMLVAAAVMMFVLFPEGRCLAQAPQEVSIAGVWWNYGQLVTGEAKMSFGIYDAPEGGQQLWDSGDMDVYLSSGMYSVLVKPNIDLSKTGQEYYLQVTVRDCILKPRQVFTATLFARHSGTAEGINAGSQAKVVVAGKECMNISSSGEVKNVQDGVERYMVPKGGIIMWSGEIRDIPSGWALCDGKNGPPDLRGRFVVSCGETTDARGEKRGFIVGESSGEFKHQLTIAEMPSHVHDHAGCDSHNQGTSGWGAASDHTPTSATGGDQPHNNLPPYYALAFIMKL
jgi:microcystin-dependent protein